MPESLRAIPPLSLLKAAGIFYLYWMLGHFITERPWLYLLLILALVPVDAVAVLVACGAVTWIMFGAIFIFAVDPVRDPVALAMTCGSIPAVMVLARLRGRLATRFFAAEVRTPWRDRIAAYLRTACVWSGVAVLLPLVSREFSMESLLPLSITLFLSAHALRAPSVSWNKSFKRIAANTVLIIASLIFSAAVLEVGARIAFKQPVPDRTMFAYSPGAFYDLRPNVPKQELRHRSGPNGETTAVSADVSAQGLRDRVFGPKQSDEYRILMLGDSFTFGLTVEFENTIGQYLETEFDGAAIPKKVVTMNLGVPATAPWQHQIYLERRGFPLEPDLVVHQLFLGNDIMDTLNRTERPLRAYDATWQTELHRLHQLSLPRIRAEQWLADHSSAYTAFRNSVGRGQITQFLSTECRLLSTLPRLQLPQNVGRPPAWEINLTDWYPEIVEGFESILQTVQEINKECAARGIGYVVYCIPQLEEISDEWFDERRRHVHPSFTYESGKGIRMLHERLNAMGVPNVALLEPMRSAPDPQLFYIESDGHTSAEGNAAIARLLHEYLTSTYFPEHPITKSE